MNIDFIKLVAKAEGGLITVYNLKIRFDLYVTICGASDGDLNHQTTIWRTKTNWMIVTKILDLTKGSLTNHIFDQIHYALSRFCRFWLQDTDTSMIHCDARLSNQMGGKGRVMNNSITQVIRVSYKWQIEVWHSVPTPGLDAMKYLELCFFF